jgi:hypothetical protein
MPTTHPQDPAPSTSSKGKNRVQSDLQQYVEDLDSDQEHEYQALLPRSSNTLKAKMGNPTRQSEENDGLHATLHGAEDKDGFDEAALDKDGSTSLTDYIPVGREALADKVPPSDAYEGKHRWDPEATWTKGEERKLVRKIDFWLLR